MELLHLAGSGHSDTSTRRDVQTATGDGQGVDDFTVALAALRLDKVLGEDLAGDVEFAVFGKLKAGEIAAVTWEWVKEEMRRDKTMIDLVDQIRKGFNEAMVERLPQGLAEFWRHRNSLHVVDGVVMMAEQIVIPPSLRHKVLDQLHGAHQGVSQMTGCAQVLVFWPGILSDIAKMWDNYRTCDTIALSQCQTHPVPPEIPTYPFEMVCSDYFDQGGMHYLITGWMSAGAKPQMEEAGVKGLIKACKETFMALGVPVELASDGGPEYASTEFRLFLQRWGVQPRMSSAYHASSNGRAEVAVKATKRALRDNTVEDGCLDTNRFTQALLIFRNMPDRYTGKSPAELLLGRRLCDTLPHPYANHQNLIANNSPVDNRWLATWSLREQNLRVRMAKMVDQLDTKALLEVGDKVRVQNQTGAHKTRWDRMGVVMVVNKKFEQYLVKMDGSLRCTARNRKFLRKIRPTHRGRPHKMRHGQAGWDGNTDDTRHDNHTQPGWPTKLHQCPTGQHRQ